MRLAVSALLLSGTPEKLILATFGLMVVFQYASLRSMTSFSPTFHSTKLVRAGTHHSACRIPEVGAGSFVNFFWIMKPAGLANSPWSQ